MSNVSLVKRVVILQEKILQLSRDNEQEEMLRTGIPRQKNSLICRYLFMITRRHLTRNSLACLEKGKT